MSASPVGPGRWIAGAHDPLPPGVRVVVTLDDTAPPVTDAEVTEVRSPFPDSRWHPVDTAAVTTAVAATRTGGAVLVRCRHGINRSALVLALTLVAEGASPDQAITTLRTARPGALTNPYFVELVRRWPEDPMRRDRDAGAQS